MGFDHDPFLDHLSFIHNIFAPQVLIMIQFVMQTKKGSQK